APMGRVARHPTRRAYSRAEELTKSNLTTSRGPLARASLLLIRSRAGARRMGVRRCARHGAEKSSSRCARRALRGSPCAAKARDTNDAPPRSSAPKPPPAGGTRVMCIYSLSHLSAVGLLAPYLTPENAGELLAAAAHRTKSEIEELLARRFPRSETLGLLAALPSSSPAPDPQLAPAQVEEPGRPDFPGTGDRELAPAQVHPRSKLAPVAPERFLLQVTIGGSTQEKLRSAQQLPGPALPSGDLVQVLDRALDALIERLERRKFAATPRPRRR